MEGVFFCEKKTRVKGVDYQSSLLETCPTKFDGKTCEMLIAWANF